MTCNKTSEKLRILLRKSRKTQLEIAVDIGVSERSIRRYLSGKEEPPIKVVLAIERVLCQECRLRKKCQLK